MSDKPLYLAIAVFYTLDGARLAVQQLQDEKKLTGQDVAVVVEKGHDGRMVTQDVGLSPRKGTATGLILGATLGVLTGGAALALGAAGGLIGRHMVNRKRQNQLTPDLFAQLNERMAAGTSLVLVVREEEMAAETEETLQYLSGELFTAVITAEVWQQVQAEGGDAGDVFSRMMEQAAERAAVPYKRVQLIVNPAAGQDEPILNTVNDVFRRYGVDWDVKVTKKFGDATEMAQTAVAEGYDLVAGYGGDGTQMEIANGVKGSKTPMAILPGGTGNAMAFELGIPRELRGALELICRSTNVRDIDLGQIGERFFMLRTYTGPEQEQVASREMKDKYGVLAYPVTALRTMKNLPVLKHRLTIDGQEIEEDGFICFIYNAGSLGGVDLPKPADIDAGDGLLDVVLINKNLRSLTAVTSFTLDFGPGKANVHHWKGKEIRVETEQTQTVWIDGEAYGQTPFTATVIPQAVRIVTP